MGTITKRTDHSGPPTWRARVRRQGYPLFSRTFSTKSEAQAWITSTESDMDKGLVPFEKSTETLEDLIDRYVIEVSPHKKGASSEIIRLKAIARQPIGSYAVQNITGSVMGQWRDKRLQQVSGSTVNRELGMLGHVFETARKEWGVAIVSNPVQAIRRPRSNPSRERRLSKDEEDLIFAHATRDRTKYLSAVITLALETAMRQSEIVGLHWDQVNLSRRTIHLRVTKNGSSRGIPLSQKAIATLEGLGEQSGGVQGHQPGGR